MKPKLFTLMLVLLSHYLAYTQSLSNSLPSNSPMITRIANTDNAKVLRLINDLDGISKSSIYENIDISTIEGSMYHDSMLTEGKVYFNKELYAKYPMRYNALNDEFEVKSKNNRELQVITRSEKISCVKGKDRYVFTKYFYKNGALLSGYLIEVVADGKYRLYEKRRKVFKEGSDAKTSFHKTIPHRFLDQIEFFVAKENNFPIHLKTSKKGMIAILDDEDGHRLKQLLKKKKGINVKDKHELAGVIAYSNAQ
ncbi:MAG: hypothetical protein AAGB24_03205 [Bacteroidota bacterium]